MSRFNEYEGDGEFNPWDGWRGRAMSGRATNAALKEFLAHLDAMPVKELLYERLYDAATGSACAVGEFAKMRGVPEEKLVTLSSEVEHIVKEFGGHEGNNGPTIRAGKEAGLPMTIAWELAFGNDSLDFKRVRVDGPPTPREARAYTVATFQLYARIEITPHERWERVRRQVVSLIQESDERLRYAAHRREKKRAVA